MDERAAGFRSDRAWTFAMDRADLWAALSATDRYTEWWPWLRVFEPDGAFTAGARWQCVISPPAPWVVRFAVHLDGVDDARSATSRITGDIEGTARLTLVDTHGGVAARLVSHLAPANPVLRTLGTLARPLVERSHDWVLDQGLRQFRRRALGDG